MAPKILLLAMLISVFLLSGCLQSGTDKTESSIKAEIEKANYCEVKDDCTIITGECPFGCYIVLNKKEVSHIQSLVNSYKSNCIYECTQVFNHDLIKCENNKCVNP